MARDRELAWTNKPEFVYRWLDMRGNDKRDFLPERRFHLLILHLNISAGESDTELVIKKKTQEREDYNQTCCLH